MTKENFQEKWLGGTLALFSISVIVSQTAMDFFSTLLCLLAIYYYFWMENPEKRLHRPMDWGGLFPPLGVGWAFALWFIVCAFGFFLNASPEAPWLFRLVIFKWVLMLYAFVYVFQRVPLPTRILPWASLVFFVSNVFALWAYLTRYDFFRGIYLDIPLSAHRLGGFFFDPMTYGHSYALCFFMLLWTTFFMTRKQPPWLSAFSWLNVLLLGLTLLFTFTRGVWFGVFWGLLISAFILKRRIGIWVTLALLSLFGLLFSVWPTFKDRVLHVFQASENYDSQRIVLWKTNWQIFKDYPLLGIGYDENSRRLREYYDRLGIPEGFFESHAHNQYLHILAGTGVLGLACYLIIIGFFMRQSLKLYRQESDPWWKGILLGAFSAQVSFHFGALTEANFEHSKVRFIMMILWALITVRAFKQNPGFRADEY
jgi:O-antigen ligase